jgi:hypothetical protein
MFSNRRLLVLRFVGCKIRLVIIFIRWRRSVVLQVFAHFLIGGAALPAVRVSVP